MQLGNEKEFLPALYCIVVIFDKERGFANFDAFFFVNLYLCDSQVHGTGGVEFARNARIRLVECRSDGISAVMRTFAL